MIPRLVGLLCCMIGVAIASGPAWVIGGQAWSAAGSGFRLSSGSRSETTFMIVTLGGRPFMLDGFWMYAYLGAGLVVGLVLLAIGLQLVFRTGAGEG